MTYNVRVGYNFGWRIIFTITSKNKLIFVDLINRDDQDEKLDELKRDPFYSQHGYLRESLYGGSRTEKLESVVRKIVHRNNPLRPPTGDDEHGR